MGSIFTAGTEIGGIERNHLAYVISAFGQLNGVTWNEAWNWWDLDERGPRFGPLTRQQLQKIIKTTILNVEENIWRETTHYCCSESTPNPNPQIPKQTIEGAQLVAPTTHSTLTKNQYNNLNEQSRIGRNWFLNCRQSKSFYGCESLRLHKQLGLGEPRRIKTNAKPIARHQGRLKVKSSESEIDWVSINKSHISSLLNQLESCYSTWNTTKEDLIQVSGRFYRRITRLSWFLQVLAVFKLWSQRRTAASTNNVYSRLDITMFSALGTMIVCAITVRATLCVIGSKQTWITVWLVAFTQIWLDHPPLLEAVI